MISETTELIMFFDEIDENSRQIRAWFGGHIIEREAGNTGNLSTEDRAKLNGVPLDVVEHADELRKKLNNDLSKYMHPSITAMRANMRKKSKTIDYEHKGSRSRSVNADFFGYVFIAPCVQSVLIPSRTIHPTLEDFDRLREYITEVEPVV